MKYLVFIYALAIILFSCHKEYSCEQCRPKTTSDSTTITNLDTTITDSTIFFDIVVNGERHFQISGKNHWGLNWAGYSESSITTSANGYGFYLLKYNTGYPSDTSITAINNWISSAYALGGYPYTNKAAQVNGISLKWIDSSGKTWATDKGVGNQQNSSFVILKRTLVTNVNGFIYFPIIYCTFNCTLYDDQGNELKLTAGRLRYGFF